MSALKEFRSFMFGFSMLTGLMALFFASFLSLAVEAQSKIYTFESPEEVKAGSLIAHKQTYPRSPLIILYND